MHSTKRVVLIGIALLALVLAAVSAPLSAFQGGVGDGTVEYNCGGSCHSNQGSAVLSMWASTLTPLADTDVTVIINASGGQAVSDGILGIMLVSDLVADATSLPTNAGWTIVSDPSSLGTTYNYYENHTYTGTGSFEWKLKAPQVPGDYKLYARSMHGGGTEYYEDFATGLSFDVDVPVVIGPPLVFISTVTVNEVLKDTVKVNVTVITNNTTVVKVQLRLNDTIIGNKTTGPYTFTIDTTKFSDGFYLLNATATDFEGRMGYRQIPVTIRNAATPATEQLVSWVWTLVAGSIAILAWIGIMIVIALMVRRRAVGKGGK